MNRTFTFFLCLLILFMQTSLVMSEDAQVAPNKSMSMKELDAIISSDDHTEQLQALKILQDKFGEAAKEIYVKHLGSKNFAVRQKSIQLIGTYKINDATVYLKKIAADKSDNPWIRREAIYSLQKFDSDLYINLFYDLLYDKSPVVYQVVARALGNDSSTSTIIALISVLDHKIPADLIWTAWESLKQIGPDAYDQMLGKFNHVGDRRKCVMINLLSEIDSPTMMEIMEAILTNDIHSEDVKVTILSAFVRKEYVKGILPVIYSLNDKSEKVRKKAYSTLKHLTGVNGRLRNEWIVKLFESSRSRIEKKEFYDEYLIKANEITNGSDYDDWLDKNKSFLKQFPKDIQLSIYMGVKNSNGCESFGQSQISWLKWYGKNEKTFLKQRIDKLAKIAADENHPDSVEAIRSLGNLHASDKIPTLLDALGSTSLSRYSQAQKSLLAIGTPCIMEIDYVYNGSSPIFKQRAMFLLGNFKNIRSVELLIKSLDGERDVRIKDAIVISLKKLTGLDFEKNYKAWIEYWKISENQEKIKQLLEKE